MKKYLVIITMLVLCSCKSKAILINSTAAAAAKSATTAEKLIASYYSKTTDFSTLYIKANAKYKDDKQTQNVTAEIKIKKDEKILVSIRFLGFTVAKALITPTSVSYYEKLGSNYFEGNYETLSKWLGADLDFFKLQNLFLGKPVNNLSKENCTGTATEKIAQLQLIDGATTKSFFIDSSNFTLAKQDIYQTNPSRSLQILYPEYQNTNQMVVPLSVDITATTESKNTTININYRSVSVNEDLSFPYSVPDGYQQIIIKQ